MSSQEDAQSQRRRSLSKRISSIAASLHATSDEFSNSINDLDAFLKQCNLGVPCWHTYDNDDERPPRWDVKEIGYARIGNRWGIAIRRRSGNYEDPENENEDSWLFNDAPRHLRLEANEHIDAMLEALANAVEKVASKIQAHVELNKQRLGDLLVSMPEAKAGRQ